MRSSIAGFVVAALVAGTVAVTGTPAAAAACSGSAHPGGEWPSYGQNLSNTRSQDAETTIGTGNVGALAPRWVFSVAAAGGSGTVESTPAVAGGCVFVTTSSGLAGGDAGFIHALDADTGELVWQTQVPIGGSVAGVYSVTVSDGKVIGLSVDGEDGPYAFALDVSTGDTVWQSERFAELGTSVNASTVVYDGMVFLATWGEDPDPNAHNGYAIVDAATGETLDTSFVIPEDQWQHGYAGGGMWGTAVVDEGTGYAYVGTANPYSKRNEHPHTNAIVKVDLNRRSLTFGDIVDSYKGTFDNYAPGLYDTPTCQTLEPSEGYNTVACQQLDIDFGASPNLFADQEGRKIVGNLQKSGIYHAAYAGNMSQAWTALVNGPSLAGNAGTTAVDGSTVFAGTNGGLVWAHGRDAGDLRWLGLAPDSTRYQAMSTANGVVYSIDNQGTLLAFDSALGIPLSRRALAEDTGGPTAAGTIGTSAGVAIARNTLFVPSAGFVVAYGL